MSIYISPNLAYNGSRIGEVASAPCGLDKSWEKYNILFSDFIKEAIWVERSATAYSLLGEVTIYEGGATKPLFYNIL